MFLEYLLFINSEQITLATSSSFYMTMGENSLHNSTLFLFDFLPIILSLLYAF